MLCDAVVGQNIGTAEEREALFDTLVDRTLQWEAWSPFKERKNATDYPIDAEALRDDFVNASSELDLVIALQKLSNLRQDRHLFVDEEFPDVSNQQTETPIKFWPDFSGAALKIFVSDTAINFSTYSSQSLTLGDEVIAVNGIDIETYYESLIPFLRFSTINGARWEFAEALSIKRTLFDPSLYRFDNTVQYTLKRGNGTNYLISLPYSNEDYKFTDSGARSLPGYELLLQTIDVDMYVKYLDENIIVLLRWKDFEDVANTAFNIIQKAKERNLLSANVILDIAESSGGSGAPDLLRILAQEPFQTTWGNVKIGDYLDDFKQGFSGPVREWLDNDVEEARANDEEFSPNVPFKLQYFSKTETGIMNPGEERFAGKVVLISGSNTGSQVDQCAAMLIDNDVAIVSLGMPCGGYSNTWEYEPLLNFPEGSNNWFEYHWNIGHTIRPNGEVLEGNPAIPEYPYLLTSENFASYYDQMIQAAEDTLMVYPVEVDCALPIPSIQTLEGRLATDFNASYKYQWYLNNEIIEGETNSILNQSRSEGTYKVEISQGLCTAESEPFESVIASIDTFQFNLFPNPVTGQTLTLEFSDFIASDLAFKMHDLSGKVIDSYQIDQTASHRVLMYFEGGIKGLFLLKIYSLQREILTTRLIIK